MCFSANVSFGAAAFLLATGAVTTIRNNSPSVRMIASVPFLFGLQQLAEGVVWQSVGTKPGGPELTVGILVYLTFALVVWPAWIPWSFFFIEPIVHRKKLLTRLGFFGLGVSFAAAILILRFNVQAYVDGNNLRYDFIGVSRMWPSGLEFLIYLVPTVVPFFISSVPEVRRAGYLVLIGLAISETINRQTVTSVWCFFASIISLYIAVQILWVQRAHRLVVENR